VKFIRLWFTDILGTLKGFAITIDELEEVLARGATIDGSSIAGFARSDESDMIAMPDPSTWQLLPWRPRENAVARMFCDILRPDGTPFEGDPRHVLRRNIQHASDIGYSFYVGPELEYFYLEDSDSVVPIDQGGYFDQTAADGGPDLRRETVLSLEELGIPVAHSHHEVAPGQHEIDLRHQNALTMADTVITYRVVVKEIASHHGVYASFMPRPMNDQNGSGMHCHLSLAKGERNAFYDEDDGLHLSAEGRSFLAGLIRHSPEITAVTNQWVNSYKRLVPGIEAPAYSVWTGGNWGDLVRVPPYQGRAEAVRIEYRAPDSACNPYLAFSVMLAAGIKGMEEGYDLGDPVTQDLEDMSPSERLDAGISRLPSNLGQALDLLKGSELVREALGDSVFDNFIRNKEIEWREFEATVTGYEVDRYLKVL
jgi:glutamine synthetase|tara:strand:- start:5597 stop:6871 length:1275 start_codon:yes stop_codon:yes gene_type:complete